MRSLKISLSFFLKNYIFYLKSLELNTEYISLAINKESMFNVIYFLKTDFLLKFTSLMDIFVVDFPMQSNRFSLNYVFVSFKNNVRIRLFFNFPLYVTIPSMHVFYKSAGWLEREVWDMFGVFFSNHKDLRRILTDYGFEGFPLRKDFPLTGYVEVRYDDSKKVVVYEPLELSQELRFFDFETPWR